MLQKIVVLTTLGKSDTSLILCGVRVASVFRKELCLFYQASGADHSLDIDQQLEKIRERLHREIPELPLSVLVGSFRGERLATTLADEHEAIMIIAGASRFRKLAASLQNSPIPFLFVNEAVPFQSNFREIVFPVDLRPQNKDAMKWAMWFGKHNQSEIIAVGARAYQGRAAAGDLLMAALKTLLTRADSPQKIPGTRFTRSTAKLANGSPLEAGLFLLLGVRHHPPGLLLGLPEEKIVNMPAHSCAGMNPVRNLPIE